MRILSFFREAPPAVEAAATLDDILGLYEGEIKRDYRRELRNIAGAEIMSQIQAAGGIDDVGANSHFRLVFSDM